VWVIAAVPDRCSSNGIVEVPKVASEQGESIVTVKVSKVDETSVLDGGY